MSQKASGEADSSTDSEDIFSTVECPTCGRDDFKSNRGMRRHHAMMHDESLSQITFECEVCNDEFDVPYAWTQKDKNTGKYCSTQCKNKVLNSPKAVTKRVHERETRTCNSPCCENEFDVPPSSDKKFCCLDCSYGNRDIDEADTKECNICGEEFRTGGPSKRDRRKTCSRECRSEWYTGRYTGKDNFAWKGGYDQWYGDNWNEMRRKARERDDYTCQACGVSESDYPRELSVHHIRPVREFKEPEDANTLDNLVTMCESCHSEWEGLYLRPDTR